MTSSNHQDLIIKELTQKLEDANAYIKKLKLSAKKSYNKKYFNHKEILTEEEKQIKQERLKKRREYMNNRYHTIYKKKKN